MARTTGYLPANAPVELVPGPEVEVHAAVIARRLDGIALRTGDVLVVPAADVGSSARQELAALFLF